MSKQEERPINPHEVRFLQSIVLNQHREHNPQTARELLTKIFESLKDDREKKLFKTLHKLRRLQQANRNSEIASILSFAKELRKENIDEKILSEESTHLIHFLQLRLAIPASTDNNIISALMEVIGKMIF